ncbi:MAG: hypothetical protein GXP62_11580 [Oligoflexia bacterium]|nr:hypothetical protein [Oligoflexia bacterium]
MADSDEDPKDGAGGQDEGAQDDQGAQGALEAVSFDDLTDGVPSDPNGWRSVAKTRMVAAGFSEAVAHKQAFEGTRDSTEKALGNLRTDVGSGQSSPQSGPSGQSDAGHGASDPAGQGGDDRSATSSSPGPTSAEVELLRAEIQTLKQDHVVRTAGQKRQELVQAREELSSGAYPELRNKDVVEGLKPRIQQLLDAGVPDYGEALKLATYAKLGVRSEAPAADDPPADTKNDHTPTPGRTNQPGRRAAQPEQVRARIAEMAFNGRSEEEVMSFAEEQRRRLR